MQTPRARWCRLLTIGWALSLHLAGASALAGNDASIPAASTSAAPPVARAPATDASKSATATPSPAPAITPWPAAPATAAAAPAQPAAATQTQSPQALLEAAVRTAGAGAAVAAITTPQGTSFYCAGQLSATDATAPTPDTIFEIGSLTKGFTGLLLAERELAGAVAPTDTLARRLTDWPARAQALAGKITLGELATHHSGLTRLPANLYGLLAWRAWLAPTPNPYATYDATQLYLWLDDFTPARPTEASAGTAGTAPYLYSNAGFGILGHALSLSEARPYGEVLRDRLLTPLGLVDTAITLSPSQHARLAPGHRAAVAMPNWDFQVLAGAGALRSTARDLARFNEFALGLTLPTSPLRAVLTLATQPHAEGGSDAQIGYAWQIQQTRQGPLFWHNGATGGYSCMLGWLPKPQVAVVVLTANSDFPIDELWSNLLRQAAATVRRPSPAATPPTTAPLPLPAPPVTAVPVPATPPPSGG